MAHGAETARQLPAIARVDELFRGADIDYRLFGGWAVDFHAGRVTRDHDDVDVAVWGDDGPAVAALLERDGWQHAPEPDEDGGTGYERDGVRLELTYLVPLPDGGVGIALRSGVVTWPSAAEAPVRVQLHGVSAEVMPREALLRDKSRARDDDAVAAKDRADAAVLAAASVPR